MPRTRRTLDAGDALNKFRRYRESQRRCGMKLLRVRVPDPHRPEFAKEAERQSNLLRGRPEEIEALAFIEAVVEWRES